MVARLLKPAAAQDLMVINHNLRRLCDAAEVDNVLNAKQVRETFRGKINGTVTEVDGDAEQREKKRSYSRAGSGIFSREMIQTALAEVVESSIAGPLSEIQHRLDTIENFCVNEIQTFHQINI